MDIFVAIDIKQIKKTYIGYNFRKIIRKVYDDLKYC